MAEVRADEIIDGERACVREFGPHEADGHDGCQEMMQGMADGYPDPWAVDEGDRVHEEHEYRFGDWRL